MDVYSDVFLKVGAIATDLFALGLGINIVRLFVVGRRASAGLKPAAQPPLRGIQAYFLLGILILGTLYVFVWSTIQLGLDSGVLTSNAKPVLLLDSFHHSAGPVLVDMVMLICFVLFGLNMARLLIRPRITPWARMFALLGLVLSLAVVIVNGYLLTMLARGR